MTITLTKTNQHCNEDFHTELEPHSHQRLDLDDEEKEEFDSKRRLELDFHTDLQRQDQAGTLHSTETLQQFKKEVQDLILCRPGQQFKISTFSSQSGEFEHILARIRMSSANLQHETYGVHTLKVVLLPSLCSQTVDSSTSVGSKTLQMTAFASPLVTSLCLNREKRKFLLRWALKNMSVYWNEIIQLCKQPTS